jgi:hypothetical protein
LLKGEAISLQRRNWFLDKENMLNHQKLGREAIEFGYNFINTSRLPEQAWQATA